MPGLKIGDVVKKASEGGFGAFADITAGTYHIQFTKAEAFERKSYIICELKYTVVEVLDGDIKNKGKNFKWSVFLPREDAKDGAVTAFVITLASLGVDIDALGKVPYSTDDIRLAQTIITMMDLDGTYQITFEQSGKYLNRKNIRKVKDATTPASSVPPGRAFKRPAAPVDTSEATNGEALGNYPGDNLDEFSHQATAPASVPDGVHPEAPADENGSQEAPAAGRRRRI